MAIITEEPDSPEPLLRKRRPEPKSKPTAPPPSQPESTSTSAKSVTPTTNPFHFWFCFTLVVSFVTLFCVLLTSLSPQDPKTWFLNLPPILRNHYSNGRTIKVQTAPNHPQVEVFSIQQGPANSDSRVLIVHGIGCSSFAFQDVVKFLGRKDVHAVAIDLPGSGFSDKSIAVMEENVGGSGFLGGVWEVYEEIKEKGLFWGFDQLVEQGYVNFEENKVRVSKKESIKAIELGSEEMGRVLGQVVDSMGLAPVDLVLHDSALGLSANWISKNRDLIRSVMILDGAPSGTALPAWVLELPVVREVLLGFRFVFERVVATCCMTSVGGLEAEAHRILLKGRDGGKAVAGMVKKLNFSFDLSEWSSLDGVKGLPIQVIWSGGWSDKWSTEGRQIAGALPQATLVNHSGGRWTQKDNAEEVAQTIHEFVSSLPKSTRQVEEEPISENSQETFSEAQGGNHHHHNHGHHHHDHHHDVHGHGHAGYMDAYGLGQGWAV
ncbi:protein AUXIN RESPONSE 4 [Sesamum alatum]|uniref:Protein AUXIN RESPONSE 4 n=1 Tax=Sesamum alatum TaxID=300844 RepID=A0AAE1YCM5_9LAMI|nr:protein AUXIN RESPONSE 4 [Sesamum alatum]